MDEQDDERERQFRPRSYVLTGGRTRPAVDLPIETLLVPTSQGLGSVNQLTAENQSIMNLCTKSSLSIAEVSAHLQLPLGVTRVLAGDLVSHKLIKATTPSYYEDKKDRLDKGVLLKVLEGLEAL
jgi:hypothetical protein